MIPEGYSPGLVDGSARDGNLVTTSGRLGTRFAVVLLLVAGMLGSIQPGAPAVAQVVPLGGGTEAPSAVVAQGVTTLPNDDVAWRVVRADAAPREDQRVVTSDTGFIVASSESLVLNDLETSSQDLLERGEAIWVAGGSEQQRASLTDDTVTYTELSLVAEDMANESGDSDLIFAGSPFDPPSDARDVNLTMATMAPSETVDVSVPNGEAIILMTAGMVSVSTGGDLAAGDAQAYDDDVMLTNDTDDPATVMFATIDDVVPPLPTFTGSATLQVRACPDGSTGSSFVPSTCEPVDDDDGFGVGLLDATFTVLPDDGSFDDGEQTWDGLAFGTYPWGAPTLPLPYVGTLWTDIDSAPLDIAQVTISASDPDVTHILYVFPVTTGSISVTVANCPTGVTPETLANAVCGEPVSSSSSITVTSPGGVTLDATDATAGGGSYQFNGLPVSNDGGVYIVDQSPLPGGYVDYLIVSGGSGDLNAPAGIALTSANPFVEVTIFNFRPSVIPDPTPTPFPSAVATETATAPVAPSGTATPLATSTVTVLPSPTPDAPVAAAAAQGSITSRGHHLSAQHPTGR